jgi:hypothetical protein
MAEMGGLVDAGGVQMHMLDAAHDAEPVSPASAERLLRAGSVGDGTPGDVLAGGDGVQPAAVTAGGGQAVGLAGGVQAAAPVVCTGQPVIGAYGSGGGAAAAAPAPTMHRGLVSLG